MHDRARRLGFVLGRLFACCVRLQCESVGLLTLAPTYYRDASERPAEVFPLLLRIAAHHQRRGQRDPWRAAPTTWLHTQVTSLAHTVNVMGGLPRDLSGGQVAAFRAGVHAQWQVAVPETTVGRAGRLRRVAAAQAALAAAHAVVTGVSPVVTSEADVPPRVPSLTGEGLGLSPRRGGEVPPSTQAPVSAPVDRSPAIVPASHSVMSALGLALAPAASTPRDDPAAESPIGRPEGSVAVGDGGDD